MKLVYMLILLLFLASLGASWQIQKIECDRYSDAGFNTKLKFIEGCMILHENEYVKRNIVKREIEKSKLKDYLYANSGDNEK